jgi:hypothetical protein
LHDRVTDDLFDVGGYPLTRLPDGRHHVDLDRTLASAGVLAFAEPHFSDKGDTLDRSSEKGANP